MFAPTFLIPGAKTGVISGVSRVVSKVFSELGRRTTAPPISWLMSLALERPGLISLAAGFTDAATLPVAETRRLTAQLLDSRDARAALQYGTTAGLAELRELTARNLNTADGRRGAITGDQLVLTNGSQQLLYMVNEALCDPRDIVLVEDPTYFVYLGILQSHGVRARGVRRDREGIDLASLEAVLEDLRRKGELPRLKVLYLVTYCQNPTGQNTSFVRKQAALKLIARYERAAGHPIYLVEDAAYRSLTFGSEQIPSALVADARGRVVYAGTYSKPFATGTRVGYGVLPEALRQKVLQIKGNHDFGSSSFLQYLLARAIASGVYARHVETLQRRYAHKAEVTLKAMRKHFPEGVAYAPPAGGLYVWAAMPPQYPSGPQSRLFQRAFAHEVLYVPGELCYAEDPARPRPRNEMRLSFGGETESHLREGIRRLGLAMREILAKPPGR